MNLFERAKQLANASDYVLKFGRYKNKKLIDVYTNDIEYFSFLESIEDNSELIEAIQKLKSRLP